MQNRSLLHLVCGGGGGEYGGLGGLGGLGGGPAAVWRTLRKREYNKYVEPQTAGMRCATGGSLGGSGGGGGAGPQVKVTASDFPFPGHGSASQCGTIRGMVRGV